MLTKKAVATVSEAPRTMANHNNLCGDYHNPASQSSGEHQKKLVEQIGVLLLYLQTTLSQKEQTQCWQIFEQSLRYYVSVKKLGGLV